MATQIEFDRELRAHWPRLRRFAYSLSRNAADADDLVQSAAERAMRSAAQWQAGTRFDSWMFRITRNLWIDTVRARGRQQKRFVGEEHAASVGFDPRPATEAGIDLRRAMAALEQLPDEQREVVALILVDGLGYREAAEALDLPIGTISSRLARGRKALLALLGEMGNGELGRGEGGDD
jgi:RNA polymerase sigma-70 factor (ECF subfamily)